MPNENFIFFGDSINAPYGVRSKENIIELTKKIYEKLLPFGIKQMVMACNTISVTTTEIMRGLYDNLNIIPTTPHLNAIFNRGKLIMHEHEYKKPIKKKSGKTKVLILATPATCKSDFLKEEIKKYHHIAEIYSESANDLVKFVETFKEDSQECENYLRGLLLPKYHDIDYIVLGCTHFPFVSKNIKKVIGEDVEIIDNAYFVSREAKHYLVNHNLENKSNKGGKIMIIDTKGGKDRQETFAKLLGIEYDKLVFL